MNHQQKSIREMTLIAVCAAVLFVQQMALSFLPNVQFTTLLVILYTKVLGFKKTSLIIVIHVIAISFFSPSGNLNPVFIPAMLMGWMLIPILLHTVFKKMHQAFALSIFGLCFGFVYGWIFIPFQAYFIGTPMLEYFIADLPFEIIMAVSNFVTILWLYEVLHKALTQLYDRYTNQKLIGSSNKTV